MAASKHLKQHFVVGKIYEWNPKPKDKENKYRRTYELAFSVHLGEQKDIWSINTKLHKILPGQTIVVLEVLKEIDKNIDAKVLTDDGVVGWIRVGYKNDWDLVSK